MTFTLSMLFAFITAMCLGSLIGSSICIQEWGYTVLGTLALISFILFQITM